MRVLSYNVRHGQGVAGLPANKRAARLIAASACDVAALQEVYFRPGVYDQPALLARMTGLTPSFFALWRTLGFDEGDLALSRLPVESVRNLDLGNARACVLLEVRYRDRLVAFGATHLAVTRRARTRQILSLAEQLPRDVPLLLAGDFNCGVRELAPLRELMTFTETPPRTFPSLAPITTLDHIGYSEHWRMESLTTLRSLASDHLPLLADLTLVG